MEGDIGVCGIALLDNFSCGISVILISNRGIYCGILQTCRMWFFNILDDIKNYRPSPSTFSEPFQVSLWKKSKSKVSFVDN